MTSSQPDNGVDPEVAALFRDAARRKQRRRNLRLVGIAILAALVTFLAIGALDAVLQPPTPTARSAPAPAPTPTPTPTPRDRVGAAVTTACSSGRSYVVLEIVTVEQVTGPSVVYVSFGAGIVHEGPTPYVVTIDPAHRAAQLSWAIISPSTVVVAGADVVLGAGSHSVAPVAGCHAAVPAPRATTTTAAVRRTTTTTAAAPVRRTKATTASTCDRVVASRPGYLADALAHAWRIRCVASMKVRGDAPASGEVYGQSDLAAKIISIRTGMSYAHTVYVVAHEAGHAYDTDHLTDAARSWLMRQLGVGRDWWGGSYAARPAERWANAVAACGGYGSDTQYAPIPCVLIRQTMDYT